MSSIVIVAILISGRPGKDQVTAGGGGRSPQFSSSPHCDLGKTLNSSVFLLSMKLNSCGAIEEMIL